MRKLKNGTKKLSIFLDLYISINNVKNLDIDALNPYSFDDRQKYEVTNYNYSKIIRRIQKEKVISIDTESKPVFFAGTKSPIALIQIATDKECFLFQLNALKNKIVSHMKEILEDDEIHKIAIGFDNDRKYFLEMDIKVKKVIDLNKIFNQLGIKESLGVKKMSAMFLNKRMLYKTKSLSISNWENRKLTKGQKLYAIEDVCTVYDIFFALLKQYPFFKKLLPNYNDLN